MAASVPGLAVAQDDEAALCAAWDGPMVRGGRTICDKPLKQRCLEPAYQAGAMVCLRYEDADPAFAGAVIATPQNSDLRELAEAAAARHGIPAPLFFALVTQESSWRSDAISPKGAIGLAQLMPETAASLGVNPRDPAQNLDGGARYLKAMFIRFGNWPLALAAYNAGPEAVEKYGGVPPYAETTKYVSIVLASAGVHPDA